MHDEIETDETPTTEALLDQELDANEAKRTLKDSQPSGMFLTQPPLAVEIGPDKKDPSRIAVRLAGRVVSVKDGQPAYIRLSMSHQRRNGPDGKPDYKSTRYAEASAVYAKAHGVAPATVRELVTFLAEFPVTVRLKAGGDSPMVVGVYPARA